MEVQGKRILITGGSSGIGLETARALAGKGAKVFIVGRRGKVVAQAVAALRGAGGQAEGTDADVTTPEGRTRALVGARTWLGGLDILINNAGGVRAGRLEDTPEADIRQMVEVNLLSPILLARAALPDLRAAGDGMIVNVASGIALVGVPFYTTYAAVKAGISHFGEALRRELKGEGVHVLTIYPAATDTPMMTSSHAGPDLGFVREPASAVAQAIVEGIETAAFQVIRGGETRLAMIAQNRSDPAALDARFLGLKPKLAEAVKDHSAL
ncbi:oxidoreductase [Bordetella sp. H567]|uniref:SDR family NAD(P)-dependent oxidoreductase n=1 Tax=Bordetella sp. H567 TaxID=1697043 RepID=UPI00081CC0EA|nr:SDR family NAD(P)-dependent oxidoreductase [Bordetella sp. H567]AOB32386.1 oxidoreductase [Bordetella sp. H567]